MTAWPHELVPGELNAFYGDPGPINGPADPAWEAANLIEVVPPWHMTEGGAPVAGIRFHRKAAESLQRVLAAIWNAYGQSQAAIEAAGLHKFDGSYNHRPVRGVTPERLSVHGYGAALDLNADGNPLGADQGTMPRNVVDAFHAEGWEWGGDFTGRKDWMHFQATFNPHLSVQPGPTIVTAPTVVPPVPVAGGIAGMIAELEQKLDLVAKLEPVLAELDVWLAQGVALRARLAPFLGMPSAGPVVPKPAPAPLPVPAPAASKRQLNITATVEGGPGDPEHNPYTGSMVDPNVPGAALPFRFAAPGKVRIYANGKSVDCQVDDVGPWNIRDPYWTTGARPQAETGLDMSGRHTNHAGIDLTPAAAKAIGIDGKGLVDWEFIA